MQGSIAGRAATLLPSVGDWLFIIITQGLGLVVCHHAIVRRRGTTISA